MVEAGTNCQPRKSGEGIFCCNKPAVRRGGCVLHAPKLTLQEKQGLTREERRAEDAFEEEFRSALACFIEERLLRGTSAFGPVRFAAVPWKEAPFKHAMEGRWEFAGCAFDQGLDLSSRAFGPRLFRHTLFRGLTSFNLSNLRDLTFSGARFDGPVNFEGAQFFGFMNFGGAVFNGDVNFRWAKIHGHVWFRGDPPDHCFSGACDFYRLEILPDGKLSFEHVNLGKASFPYVDLERPVFLDVSWHKPSGGIIRRGASLWDEFRPRGAMDADDDRGVIAESYRQLVLTYERRRDYETAESFHIGEMEAKRKAHGSSGLRGRSKRVFNIYSAYRLLSNYGTGIWQAFTVLLVLAAFSALSLFAGFRAANSSEVIRYVPAFRLPPTSVFGDFWRAMLFTLSTATLQRDRPYEPVGDWSHFLGSVAILAIAGQAALVLLAIRRRFRR